MLEKPKFLTGKVKEFINVVGRDIPVNNFEILGAVMLSDIVPVYLFYNQPFDPKMIEKYFKDFNLLSRNGAGEEPHFGFKNGTYHLWFTYYRVIIERNNPSETHKTMLPLTLNHFISDCIRAGITLEWRE